MPSVELTLLGMTLAGALVTVYCLCSHHHLIFAAAPSSLAASDLRWRWGEKGSRSGVGGRAFLFCYRLVAFAWTAWVLGSLMLRRAGGGGANAVARLYTFYTVWNYTLQAVWWLVGTACSAAALCGPRGPPRWLRLLAHALLSVCLPASVLVSIVLWSVLLPADWSAGHHERDLNFYSYSMHALNTLMLYFEWYVDRLLLKPAALWLLLSWCLLYAIAVWLHHDLTSPHFWPYFFFDQSSWVAVPWLLALLGLHLLVYGAVHLLSRCKARALSGVHAVELLQEAEADPMAAARSDHILDAAPTLWLDAGPGAGTLLAHPCALPPALGEQRGGRSA